MNEFTHYSNHKSSAAHADNCGAALENPVIIEYGNGVTKLGINYSGWPLSYMQNGRSIPKSFYGYLVDELKSDNLAYVENLKKHLIQHGYDLEALTNGKEATK